MNNNNILQISLLTPAKSQISSKQSFSIEKALNNQI
jgi:hypothetical protein